MYEVIYKPENDLGIGKRVGEETIALEAEELQELIYKATKSADLLRSDDTPCSATKQTKLGDACCIHDLYTILQRFVLDTPIRYDTKGPIEIYYESSVDGGSLIFK